MSEELSVDELIEYAYELQKRRGPDSEYNRVYNSPGEKLRAREESIRKMAKQDQEKAVEEIKAGNGVKKIPSKEEITTSATGGRKGTKIERYDLIPVEPLRLLARQYGLGAKKYDDGSESNWRKGYEWNKNAASLLRHFEAWRGGEDMDTDSFDEPTPHLAAVAWHAFALLEFARTHPEYDDRFKS